MRRFPIMLVVIAILLSPSLSVRPAESAPGVPATTAAKARDSGELVSYQRVATWGRDPVLLTPEELPWPKGHRPGGVGFDPDSGALYVTDTDHGVIRVFDATHSELPPIYAAASGGLSRPVDVDALGSRRLVIADWGTDGVLVLDSQGQIERRFEVAAPRSVAAARGTMPGVEAFVLSRYADISHGDLYLLNADGGVRKAAGFEQLDFPSSLNLIPVDPPDNGLTGTLLVPERNTKGINRLNPELSWMVMTAHISAADDPILSSGFWAPIGTRAAAGLHGSVYGPEHVIAGTSCGTSLARARWVEVDRVADELPPLDFGLEDVRDLAVHPDGRTYASHAHGVAYLGHLQDIMDPQSYPGFLKGAWALAAGDQLAILGRWPQLRLWSLDGRPLDLIRDERFRYDTDGLTERDVAVAGGTVYAAVTRRYLLDEASLFRIRGGVIDGEWNPSSSTEDSIAVAAHGDAVALHLRAEQSVWVYPNGPDGTHSAWSYATTDEPVYVWDIAMDDRHVFLSNLTSESVEVRTWDGDLVRSIWTGVPPTRVAVGPAGNLFVLTAAKWVFAYAPKGEGLGAWPVGVTDDVERPLRDIAVDARGKLYVLDESGLIHVYEPFGPNGQTGPGRTPPRTPPPTDRNRCAVLLDKVAQPEVVHIGENVQVDLSVSGICPPSEEARPMPLDVVLAIDQSGSMRGKKMADAKAAALTFATSVPTETTRLGLVSFGSYSYRRADVSFDYDDFAQAVSALEASGGTSIVAGYGAAYEALAAASYRPEATRVILFLSDGVGFSKGLDELLSRSRREGIVTITVAFGASIARELLTRMASDPSYFYEAQLPSQLAMVYRSIARRITTELLLDSGVVTDLVPDNMQYLEGSGWPEEPQWDPSGRELRWHLDDVLSPGSSLHYKLRPQQAGLWPTNAEATLAYRDGTGVEGEQEFPVPSVRVLPEKAHLPLTITDDCRPGMLHVALILDASSSMDLPIQAGDTPKIRAVLEATGILISAAQPDRVWVSIITFNDQAELIASDCDPQALFASLRRVTTRPGTRIDLGLALARQHIQQLARTEDVGHDLVVLLSDGLPMPGSRIATSLEAEKLRKMGVDLFTLAVGSDADSELLRSISGGPGYHYEIAQVDLVFDVFGRLLMRHRPCIPTWPGRTCDPDLWP